MVTIEIFTDGRIGCLGFVSKNVGGRQVAGVVVRTGLVTG